MKLDLNFNKSTKLRDWWKQVYNNFKIIESECSETRVIAQSALTSEEAREYMAEFINSTPEYISAIEGFSQLLAENGGVVEALEEMSEKRLKYYLCESEFDVQNTTDNAICFCKSGTLNTPTNGNGILLNFEGVCQYWVTVDGNIYSRQSNGEWLKSDKAVNNRIDTLNEVIKSVQQNKSEVVFGKYAGNGEADRFINLGFTPVAVEIYTDNGLQGSPNGGGDESYGGFALAGLNCGGDSIKVDTNGFHVKYDFSNNKFTNKSNEVYYFKAYKTGTIMEVS